LISRHPHCPTLLIGDPYRMFLVLRNLVDNAIKHTPSGLVRVHVGFEPIARKRLPPGAQLLPKSAALSAANLRKMARAARDHIMFDEHSDAGSDEQTGEQIMLIVHVVDSGSGIDAAMIQDIASVKSLVRFSFSGVCA
jgi:signal transduction histidine kinase